jgi:hypothetical protein
MSGISLNVGGNWSSRIKRVWHRNVILAYDEIVTILTLEMNHMDEFFLSFFLFCFCFGISFHSNFQNDKLFSLLTAQLMTAGDLNV